MSAENKDGFGYGNIPTATLTFLAHLTESVLACSVSSEQASQELRAIRGELGARSVAKEAEEVSRTRKALLPTRHPKARDG
jgi:hypothetical protein